MKHIFIYNKLLQSMLSDSDITGIMLMGSVACGTASPSSDLDIMVLCNRNEFSTEYIDGILVEYLYLTYESAKAKLCDNDMDVYHYLSSRIDLDRDGRFSELREYALIKYKSYTTDPKIKSQIHHWLISTKIKLASAVNNENETMMNFITATSSWKVLEAVWAVNDKPMPPSGSIARFLKDLHTVPFDKWFSLMFCGNSLLRTDTILKIIDWVLPLLHP